MGSLDPYHVVLLVNSVQEAAIRDVFHTHNWVCFMAALPDNVVDNMVQIVDDDTLSFLQLFRDVQTNYLQSDLSADGKHHLPKDDQNYVAFNQSANVNGPPPKDAQSDRLFDQSTDVNDPLPKDAQSHGPFDLSADMTCSATDSKSVYENYTTVTFEDMLGQDDHRHVMIASAEMPENYMAEDIDSRLHGSVRDTEDPESGELTADIRSGGPDEHEGSVIVKVEPNFDGSDEGGAGIRGAEAEANFDEGGTGIGGSTSDGFYEVKVERESSVDGESGGVHSSSSTITTSTEETLSNVEDIDAEFGNFMEELDGEVLDGFDGTVHGVVEYSPDTDDTMLVDFRNVKSDQEFLDIVPVEEHLEAVSDGTAMNNMTEAKTVDHNDGMKCVKQTETLPVVNTGVIQVKITPNGNKLFSQYRNITNLPLSKTDQLGVDGEHSSKGSAPAVSGEHSSKGSIPTVSGEDNRKGSIPTVPGEYSREGSTPAVPGEHSRKKYIPTVLKHSSKGSIPTASGAHSMKGSISAVLGEHSRKRSIPAVLKRSRKVTAPTVSGECSSKVTAPTVSGERSSKVTTPTVSGERSSKVTAPTVSGERSSKVTAPTVSDISVKNRQQPTTNSRRRKTKIRPVQKSHPQNQTVFKSTAYSNCKDQASKQMTAGVSGNNADSEDTLSDDSQDQVGTGRSEGWHTSPWYTFGNKNLADTDSAHKCPVCHALYISERMMRRHMFKQHREVAPKFSCDVCYNQYSTRDELRAHRRESGHIASQSESFQCELCGQCMKRKQTLANHMKTVHSDEYRYSCEICGTMFKTVARVNAHKASAHTIEPTPCDICGKTFPRKRLMKDHRKRHVSPRNFQCEECGKAFLHKQLLKQHLRVHSGEKPFKCSLCTYACAVKPNLAKHMRVHNKTKV